MVQTKPTVNLDERPLDEWRAELAGGKEEDIPKCWWNKTQVQKRIWLQKKIKQGARHEFIDLEKERQKEAKIRINVKLNKKKREAMKATYEELGLW